MTLIPEAGRALRMYSVRAMAAAVAVQSAWLAIPDDMRATLPGWVASSVTIALLVLGIVGRLVPQESVSDRAPNA